MRARAVAAASTVGLATVLCAVGCADEGSVVTLELESIEAHACDCGASSRMDLDAFFSATNSGTEPGTVEPVVIELNDATSGMLLIRYEQITPALLLEDGGTPPIWDGIVPPDSSLRFQLVVRSPAVPANVSAIMVTALVSLRINGVERPYRSAGAIPLFYSTM